MIVIKIMLYSTRRKKNYCKNVSVRFADTYLHTNETEKKPGCVFCWVFPGALICVVIRYFPTLAILLISAWRTIPWSAAIENPFGSTAYLG